jgi:hypothetical protein
VEALVGFAAAIVPLALHVVLTTAPFAEHCRWGARGQPVAAVLLVGALALTTEPLRSP